MADGTRRHLRRDHGHQRRGRGIPGDAGDRFRG
jgi:hypothetical protein